MTTYSVQIIGGSLAGLSAACLLRDAGHRVELHERSPSELDLGRRLLARTREVGNRSQVLGTFVTGDPKLIFNLQSPATHPRSTPAPCLLYTSDAADE